MLRDKARTGDGAKMHTKRHLNYICNAFNTHEGERNNCHNRDRRPAELLDQNKWQGKQIQGNTLLEMNAICVANTLSWDIGTPRSLGPGHTRFGNRRVDNSLHAA